MSITAALARRSTLVHARRAIARVAGTWTAWLLGPVVAVSLTTPTFGAAGARADGEAPGGAMRPLSLAAADFDEDGVADLLAGHAAAAGGLLTLHLGNPDAIYPHAPAARARRPAGPAPAPFQPGPRLTRLPGPPDLLQAGDFDADGHVDVIAAAAGRDAVVLRGDGRGALAPPQRIPLPGAPTAMAVGDLNGPDGLADVVFAVTTTGGPRLLMFAGFDGAWVAAPVTYDLPAPATAIEIAALDGRHSADIALAAGRELLIVHGRDRSPRGSRAAGAAPTVERHALPFVIRALVAGDFTGDGRPDLAVASADDVIHVFATSPGNLGDGRFATPPDGWTFDTASMRIQARADRLVRARLTSRAAHDLLAVDRAGGQVRMIALTGGARSQVVARAGAVLPMRLDTDARDDLVVLGPGDGAPVVLAGPAAATRVVTNANDTGPGSLRQAILDANAGPGDDVITFDIPGPGPHTIVPLTPLPPLLSDDPESLQAAVVIDGTSEPDFAGRPIVEVSGAAVGASGAGLTISSPACVVRGLIINGFAVGILFTLVERGLAANNGVVEGNYIGTDASGTTALGNGAGVMLGIGAVADFVVEVTVGGTAPEARNVISGNGLGVFVSNGLHRILGNYIGTDASGAHPLGNTARGIALISAHLVEVGGAAAGARNTVSANGDDGIFVTETGSMLVRNNYVGTDASGTRALGNGGDGIDVPDSVITVAGNVISGNAGLGIFAPSVASQVDILDNRIGTNSAGTAALGNLQSGVQSNGFGYTVRGNLVSGNVGHGIRLGGLENEVQQNLIGTDISGTQPLGNGGDGIQVTDFVNTIGGEGNGNIIAFNGGRGIVVPLPFPALLTILSNSMHANGGLGIDLGGDGVTPNDACDADEQANAPVLTGVTGSPASLTVTGALNSLAGTRFLVQFFASPSADPSGYGEGATPIGAASVTTNASCEAAFSVTLASAVGAGPFITATATRAPDAFGRRATSEFSNAVELEPPSAGQAIRSLMAEVESLVRSGRLHGAAGFVLHLNLRAALFFAERGRPLLAARQLDGFVTLVELFVRVKLIDAEDGRALVAAADAIIAVLRPT
jgi:hypothetical protein